jgi:hypothetical protein
MGRIARWRKRRQERRKAHSQPLAGGRTWQRPTPTTAPANRQPPPPPPPPPTPGVEFIGMPVVEGGRRVGVVAAVSEVREGTNEDRLKAAKEDLDKALEERYLKDREECWEEAKRRKQGKEKTRLLFVSKMAKRGWTAMQVEQREAMLTDG